MYVCVSIKKYRDGLQLQETINFNSGLRDTREYIIYITLCKRTREKKKTSKLIYRLNACVFSRVTRHTLSYTPFLYIINLCK